MVWGPQQLSTLDTPVSGPTHLTWEALCLLFLQFSSNIHNMHMLQKFRNNDMYERYDNQAQIKCLMSLKYV